MERYGPSVLLEPQTRGISLAVWIAPPIGVAAAIGVFVIALRHMRRRPTASDGDDEMSDDDLQPYYERIEASVSGDKVDRQDVKDG